MRVNYHTHTNFDDGTATMEEMVISAIEKKFDVLGFSFHSFTPFDTSYCIRNYPQYVLSFNTLKQKYQDKIKLVFGIELDLFGEKIVDSEYVIGSVHYIKKNDKYYPIDENKQSFDYLLNTIYNGDAKLLVHDFYDEVIELTKLKPTIYGHFDLIGVFNDKNYFFDESATWYLDEAKRAVDALPKNAIVEINLARLFKKTGGAYPQDEIVEYMKMKGCRFVLSSDAHKAEAIGYRFDDAIKKYGITFEGYIL